MLTNNEVSQMLTVVSKDLRN